MRREKPSREGEGEEGKRDALMLMVCGDFFFWFWWFLVVASHKLRPRVCRFNLPPELSLHHGQLQQRQHSEAVVPHTPHLPPAAQHCHRSAVGEDYWKHRCQSRASCAEPLWNPTLTRWQMCLGRYSDGSRLSAAALRQSVSRYQAGAG